MKIIGVYDADPRFGEYQDLKDIPKHKVKEVIHFFESYKKLQGKEVKILGVGDKKEAIQAIMRSKKNYEQKEGRD
jgi:inorganic pyrophosphatase